MGSAIFFFFFFGNNFVLLCKLKFRKTKWDYNTTDILFLK